MGGGTFSPSPSKPQKHQKNNLKYVPLQDHPIFKEHLDPIKISPPFGNLAAFDDTSSRLYLWDLRSLSLHRVSILQEEDEDGGDVQDSLILAASHSETLVPDAKIKCDIRQISLNADGSLLILSGDDSVHLMFLYAKATSSTSSSNGKCVKYRTSKVGSQIFSAHNKGLQVLQVTWHPYSKDHVGILSSDSVLRLFDLPSDLVRPEQEFYLQPFELGRCQNAVSIYPVAFSFGGQHLWDRFSIFVLFSDGSTYVLCPVIPFGSVCSWAFLNELYEDVKGIGLKSSNTDVISNSNLALDWLESTFPELADQPMEEGNKLVLRAHPYAPVDASLMLQGPLSQVFNGDEKDESRFGSAYCEGKAVELLYSSIGKDSVLVIAWSSGQLQIDALADEVLPLWNIGSSPRFSVDPCGRIKGVAMICESNVQKLSSKLTNSADAIWLGPPLLRLAIIDLALPKYALDNCLLALFPDPFLEQRFYCLHGAGIDLISLHFLPFSNILDETNKMGKEPSVLPVLITSNGGSSSALALCGFVAIADASGRSKIVGITSSHECVVLESKGWPEAAPVHYDMDIQSDSSSDTGDVSGVVSKELLNGPKAIAVPPMANLRSLIADSIEGRSTLHQYMKLFHENYVQYAHKVFVELEHHENYLKTVLEDQNKRIHEAKQKLLNVGNKERSIGGRINQAFRAYELLEQRLQNFRMLPGAKKKPLSAAEREFKALLEGFADVELDALRSSIEASSARLRRSDQSSPVNTLNVKGQSPARRENQISNSQLQKIKTSLDLLTNINDENAKKINLIENGLKSQEKLQDVFVSM